MKTYQISVGHGAEIFKDSELPMAVTVTEQSENGETTVEIARINQTKAEAIISSLKQAISFAVPVAG